ncbi:hypothetical protein CNEO2_90015 [Clostridium neonatale]|nr:hypothetical protein CNEO2_460092 [Clostridium neonatale]CAI3698403.1 hypothetical protein CNEO2_90015 [Clostridium neonatale]CAI3731897.1 hypothetical protein CNEO2_90015 [Clostridium neonatale]
MTQTNLDKLTNLTVNNIERIIEITIVLAFIILDISFENDFVLNESYKSKK